MKARILEHALSLIFVSLCLLVILFFTQQHSKITIRKQLSGIQELIELDFVDYNSPFHKALLEDVMNIHYPGRYDENHKRLQSLFDFKQDRLIAEIQSSHLKENLTLQKFWSIMGMYLKFIFVFVLVMILTYYGVQTLGVWRFVRRQQQSFAIDSEKVFSRAQFKKNPGRGLRKLLLAAIQKIAEFFFSMVSFAPSYVIAYSIRTEFNTDVLVFVVILAVLTNGLLILYANRFYLLLMSENCKGYVETAMVKNLNKSYKTNTSNGISFYEIFSPVKQFKGHILGHIFANARFQYLSTLKEQAAFLITGLVIIEMALNIHGHLSYEMLRQLLQKNYDIVVLIFLCFFYTVKFTEIFTDYIAHRVSTKFSNVKRGNA